MMRLVSLQLVLLFLIGVAAASATAQPAKRHDGRERYMSQEERQRMREDMRDAYRQRQERPQKAKQQTMSPEERGKLRRDIENANKDLRR